MRSQKVENGWEKLACPVNDRVSYRRHIQQEQQFFSFFSCLLFVGVRIFLRTFKPQL